MSIDAPGVYSDIPMDVYLGDPVVVPSLSSSIAITMLQKSPFHAWATHARNPDRIPREDSKEASIGSIAHEMLLEGTEETLFEMDPEDYPGKRGGIPDGWTNDAIRDARDEAREKGLVPMLKKHAVICRAMVKVAREYIKRSAIAGAFESGEAETTAVSTEGATWLRCRPDWLNDEWAVHLKTTARSAKPEVFSRGLLPSMGYDVALAFYERVIAGATGSSARRSVILVQEQAPPFACSLVALDPAYQAIADRKVERAIALWAQCMKSGDWPCYPAQIFYAEPKPWEIAEVEGQEIEGFLGRPDPEQEEHGIQI